VSLWRGGGAVNAAGRTCSRPQSSASDCGRAAPSCGSVWLWVTVLAVHRGMEGVGINTHWGAAWRV